MNEYAIEYRRDSEWQDLDVNQCFDLNLRWERNDLESAKEALEKIRASKEKCRPEFKFRLVRITREVVEE